MIFDIYLLYNIHIGYTQFVWWQCYAIVQNIIKKKKNYRTNMIVVSFLLYSLSFVHRDRDRTDQFFSLNKIYSTA